MPSTKAVILARGLGTRMRRAEPAAALSAEQVIAADRGVKGLVPVGRPFLDYVLSGLADAGIEQVCLVIGPEHEPIRARYTREAQATRLQLAFAVQSEPRGTADAVLAARAFAGEDPFLVLNSDNLYPLEALRRLVALAESGLIGYQRNALIERSNIPPERVAGFALIEARDDYLTRIVEKPDRATAASFGVNPLVSMNSWRFGPAIFEACEQVGPSPRGELELQDAVRYAMQNLAERFRVVPMAAGVLDLSSRSDIPAVTERLRGIEARL